MKKLTLITLAALLTAIRLNGESQSAESARARLEAIAARIRIEVD